MGLSSKQTTGSRGAPAGAFSATCFELPSESCPSVWLGALGEIWNIVDSSCTHVPRSASARARARPREARAHTQTRPWTVNKVPRVCALLSWNLGSESAKLLVQVTHHHGNRSIRSYVFFLIKHRFPIIIKKARTPFGKFVGPTQQESVWRGRATPQCSSSTCRFGVLCLRWPFCCRAWCVPPLKYRLRISMTTAAAEPLLKPASYQQRQWQGRRPMRGTFPRKLHHSHPRLWLGLPHPGQTTTTPSRRRPHHHIASPSQRRRRSLHKSRRLATAASFGASSRHAKLEAPPPL
jgi:hypothetical protein